MAQLFRCLSLAQVMIPGSWDLAPHGASCSAREGGPTSSEFLFFFFKDFIYLFIETQLEREAETQAEGEAGTTQGA